MAELLRTYECQICEARRSRLDTGIPICCKQPMKWKQTREYHPENRGWDTGMRAPAIDFNQTKGRIAPIDSGIEVNSLHDIRRIERESEKMARDGVGQQYVFRKYAQDAANAYENTLGPDPAVRPTKPFQKQVGPVDPEMGPGAREDLASPLRSDV